MVRGKEMAKFTTCDGSKNSPRWKSQIIYGRVREGFGPDGQLPQWIPFSLIHYSPLEKLEQHERVGVHVRNCTTNTSAGSVATFFYC